MDQIQEEGKTFAECSFGSLNLKQLEFFGRELSPSLKARHFLSSRQINFALAHRRQKTKSRNKSFVLSMLVF